MIKNKNQLKKKLKKNKENLILITHQNPNFPKVIGVPRKIGKVKSNAFTLSTITADGTIKDSWIYYRDIKVKDNMLYYLDEQDKPFIIIRIVELEDVI